MFYGQCNIKYTEIDDKLANNGMSHLIWESKGIRPYSEGIDGYYLTFNNTYFTKNKESLFNMIVISHVMVGYSDENIPNKLTITLPEGIIELKADQVSYNTFGMVRKMTSDDQKIVECNFVLSDEIYKKLLYNERFLKIKIENYKNNKTLLEIDDNKLFPGQLNEMLKCVNNIAIN